MAKEILSSLSHNYIIAKNNYLLLTIPTIIDIPLSLGIIIVKGVCLFSITIRLLL